MVIDTSVLIAILAQEPEAQLFSERIERDAVRLLSAASYVETSIVTAGRTGRQGIDDLEKLLGLMRTELVPVTAAQARGAAQAHLRFGRGHHPARLNFGDCFAYALAMERGEPLLFKGEDFAQTDVAHCR